MSTIYSLLLPFKPHARMILLKHFTKTFDSFVLPLGAECGLEEALSICYFDFVFLGFFKHSLMTLSLDRFVLRPFFNLDILSAFS